MLRGVGCVSTASPHAPIRSECGCRPESIPAPGFGTGILALGAGGEQAGALPSPAANVSVNSGISNTRPFPSVTHIVAPHTQVPEPTGGLLPFGEGALPFCASLRQKKKKKNNNNNTHKDGLSFGFKSSSSVPGLGRGFFIAIALQTGSSAIRDKDSASQDNGPWSGAVPPAVRGRCPGQPPLLPQGGGGARMLIINILPIESFFLLVRITSPEACSLLDSIQQGLGRMHTHTWGRGELERFAQGEQDGVCVICT